MITLYSYPELFGVADNNGYGLKVFAFLRLNGMPFKHEHVFDAAAAPSPISSTISTPRSKQFVVSAGNLVRHCHAIHGVVMAHPRST